MALDGFDMLSISFAAPGIAADWHIDRSVLGLVRSDMAGRRLPPRWRSIVRGQVRASVGIGAGGRGVANRGRRAAWLASAVRRNVGRD